MLLGSPGNGLSGDNLRRLLDSLELLSAKRLPGLEVGRLLLAARNCIFQVLPVSIASRSSVLELARCSRAVLLALSFALLLASLLLVELLDCILHGLHEHAVLVLL